jgi:hypothetical protein
MHKNSPAEPKKKIQAVHNKSNGVKRFFMTVGSLIDCFCVRGRIAQSRFAFILLVIISGHANSAQF